jgi:HK97 family phage major capsid protein
MISLTSNVLSELESTLTELERLTSQPTLSSKDEKRHAFLISKVAILRDHAKGTSLADLKNYERDRLLREAGLPRMPEAPKTRLQADIEQEYRDWLLGRPVRTSNIPPDREVRANEAGQQSIAYSEKQQGGTFVAQGFWDRYQLTLKQHDEIFESWAHNDLQTETGATVPLPVIDDTSNSSTLVGETIQSTEADVANFAQQQLNAWTFRSGYVAVSMELAQDSAFPLGSVLEKIFALRHARGVGKYLITGSGVNQPTGLLTAILGAGVSPLIASGSSTNDGSAASGSNSIGSQDLVKLFFNVNPAYRKGSIFFMNDSTLSSIMNLLDKSGRPLVSIVYGYDISGERKDYYYVLGRRVAICPSVPGIASAANSVIFGNPDYFVVRSVPSSLYFRAFKEAGGIPSTTDFILRGLVGVESFVRYDSDALIPNSQLSPFSVLQQHS